MGFLEEVFPKLGLGGPGRVWIEGEEFKTEGKVRAKTEVDNLLMGGAEKGTRQAVDVRGGLGSTQNTSSLRPQQSSSFCLQDPCPAPPSAAGPP